MFVDTGFSILFANGEGLRSMRLIANELSYLDAALWSWVSWPTAVGYMVCVGNKSCCHRQVPSLLTPAPPEADEWDSN